ncbi:hypothetical protein QR685DRAFT_203689 [Neurospora intermedia]|uniref:Uncharacterized protein n=1 Tax=Neurospora intermedia TaxID=5142 RepID=A0ABR3DFK2_NEUIN
MRVDVAGGGIWRTPLIFPYIAHVPSRGVPQPLFLLSKMEGPKSSQSLGDVVCLIHGDQGASSEVRHRTIYPYGYVGHYMIWQLGRRSRRTKKKGLKKWFAGASEDGEERFWSVPARGRGGGRTGENWDSFCPPPPPSDGRVHEKKKKMERGRVFHRSRSSTHTQPAFAPTLSTTTAFGPPTFHAFSSSTRPKPTLHYKRPHSHNSCCESVFAGTHQTPTSRPNGRG